MKKAFAIIVSILCLAISVFSLDIGDMYYGYECVDWKDVSNPKNEDVYKNKKVCVCASFISYELTNKGYNGVVAWYINGEIKEENVTPVVIFCSDAQVAQMIWFEKYSYHRFCGTVLYINLEENKPAPLLYLEDVE